MIIRYAIAQDANAIANLSNQLGYRTTANAVHQRLEQMQHLAHSAVFVAALDAGVIGWIHIYLCQLLQTDLQAEIGGLVVDDNYRGSGVGRQLLQQVEQWAQHRCHSIYVRSNIVRDQAHIFYEKMGYNYIKTSLAFRKDLVTESLHSSQ